MTEKSTKATPTQQEETDPQREQAQGQGEEPDPSAHRPPAHPIEKALNAFLDAMDCIRRTRSTVIPRTAEWAKGELKRHQKQIEKFEKHLADDGNTYEIQSAHDAAELLDAQRAFREFRPIQMFGMLERSLFSQIFSEFDAFTGALLTAIYTNRTDLLKGISREVSLSELLQFENLDAVKLNMLEKEIETFRRASYPEQFAVLAKKFGFATLTEFEEWGEFNELAQRRNLLTHNGGRVSEQYLLVCEREGHKFSEKPKLGEMLSPDGAYFTRAVILLSKVGFMLAHTLWRKLFSKDFQTQSQAINTTIYSILEQRRWRTAAELARFSLSPQIAKGIPDIDSRIRLVNCAIAYKFSDRDAEARKLLGSLDWTATYRDFKLAVAVLRDEFRDAASLMREIGKTGELINQVAYHQWPLFYRFRESEAFQLAYAQIYDVSFSRAVVEKSNDIAMNAGVPASLEAAKLKIKAPRSRKSKPPTKTPNAMRSTSMDIAEVTDVTAKGTV
jgi:hypothetical protein